MSEEAGIYFLALCLMISRGIKKKKSQHKLLRVNRDSQNAKLVPMD